MSFKTGFISNPLSMTLGDSIKVEYFLKLIEKESSVGCGLHYELYTYRVISRLNELLTFLPPNDVEVVKLAAKQRGFQLDDDTLQISEKLYQNTLNKIHMEQK